MPGPVVGDRGFRVDSLEVIHRRQDVFRADRAVSHKGAPRVGRSHDGAGRDAGSGQHAAETAWVMVAPGIRVDSWRAPEF